MLPGWIRLYRLAFGVIALVAVITNYVQLDDPYFWRFFTNQSNLIAGIVLIFGATVFPVRHPPLWWDVVRGSAVLIMLVTGIVYAALLGGVYNPFDGSHRWASSVLHQLVPIVMVAELLIVPLHRSVALWTISLMASYPLAWLGYTMMWGQQSGWYPYDFLDPAQNGGAVGVTITVAVLINAFLLVATLIVLTGRVIRTTFGEETAPGHTS